MWEAYVSHDPCLFIIENGSEFFLTASQSTLAIEIESILVRGASLG